MAPTKHGVQAELACPSIHAPLFLPAVMWEEFSSFPL